MTQQAGTDNLPRATKPAFADRLWASMTRGGGLGLTVSLFIHATLLIVAGLITWGAGPGSGTGEGAGRGPGELEMGIAAGPGLSGPLGGVPEILTPGVADATASDSASSMSGPALDAPSIEGIDDGTGVAIDVGGAVGGGGLAGGISGGMGGGGGGGGASFFGLEAVGSRFVYVIDVSGSMASGGRIEAAKAELLKSIEALSENSQFVVILFSNDAKPLGEKATWTEATASGKRWARRAIQEVQSEGGTYPAGAFTMGLAVEPAPDAVYLMTDGDFPDSEMEAILEANRRRRVPVHAICFIERTGEERMRRIARSSGGTYVYVAGAGP
jgi:hypothetical protein